VGGRNSGRSAKLLVENGLSHSVAVGIFGLFGKERFAIERDTSVKKMCKKIGRKKLFFV
jgi:hypothetical protein